MNFPSGTQFYFSNQLKGQAYYLLNGDLNQMGQKERFLRSRGYIVLRSQSGTYPGFPQDKGQDYLKALGDLFKFRVAGWWSEPLVDKGICTQAEYDAALEIECAKS